MRQIRGGQVELRLLNRFKDERASNEREKGKSRLAGKKKTEKTKQFNMNQGKKKLEGLRKMRRRRPTEGNGEMRDEGAGSGGTRVQAWRLWHAAPVGMDSISHSQAWAGGPVCCTHTCMHAQTYAHKQIKRKDILSFPPHYVNTHTHARAHT